jgi:hypothetical protein
MAFLDFIRNRQQQSPEQSSQQQKPETAREMYTRQAGEERAGAKPMEQLPQADRDQAKELGARLDKATQHLRQDAPAQTPSPSDSAGSPEAMRQNMTGQENAAPSLSPTSAQRGTTEQERPADSPSREDGEGARQTTQQRPQTIARTTPSWER